MKFVVHGSGAPLLLLHGWAMHGGIFAGLVPYLETQFSIHTVDLPGHGRSIDRRFVFDETVAILATYLSNFAPAVLVGWSLGGAIATELALRPPTAVRAVVPIASSPRLTSSSGWPHAMPMALLERFADELVRDWEAVVDRFLVLEALGSPNEKAELRWLRAEVYAHGKPNPEALMSGLQMLQSIDLRARLSGLRVPSLWLGGRRDRIVPPEAILAAAELCGGRVEIFAAAHAPFLTHPEAVAKSIIEFAAAH